MKLYNNASIEKKPIINFLLNILKQNFPTYGWFCERWDTFKYFNASEKQKVLMSSLNEQKEFELQTNIGSRFQSLEAERYNVRKPIRVLHVQGLR